MLEDLKSASESLRAALTGYLAVCSSARSCIFQGGLLHSRPIELADQIQREVESFAQYEAQLQDAKMAIHVARNSVPSIVPINTLPQEVLVGIFHSVLALAPHATNSLAQVCFRWRFIALNTCSLWTRIKYFPPEVIPEYTNPCVLQWRLIDHVNLHLSRSGTLPLHLYLLLNGYHEDRQYEWYDQSTGPLFDVAMKRTKSLHLTADGPNWGRVASDSQELALSNLLLKSARGTLTEIYFSCWRYAPIATQEDDPPRASLFLELTSEQLDEVFASVEVLHLHNMYPPWTSAAYHNLVDFRLTGTSDCKISDTTLVSILRMSPHLRIFHLGFSIIREATDPASPVQLVDLEFLRVIGKEYGAPILFHEKIEHLLSLIHPGKKPLRLYLEKNPLTPSHRTCPEQGVSMEHTRAFIERSNLVELNVSTYPLSLQLLPLPIMKHLVLRECDVDDQIILLPDDAKRDAPSSQPPLGTLYLSRCSIALEAFRSSLQTAPVQRLVVYESHFNKNGRVVPREQIELELSGLCPVIVFEDRMLDCMGGWSLL